MRQVIEINFLVLKNVIVLSMFRTEPMIALVDVGGMFKFRWLCDLIYFGVRWRVGRQDDHHSPHSEPPQS